MIAELVKLRQYKGDKAVFYSVSIDGNKDTLFEQFVEENYDMFLQELRNIDMRIKVMNEETGAREQYFKLHEGKPGDGVAALYDFPGKKLRLYCLRFGSTTVILGGGGQKKTRTYQEDKELDKQVKLMSRISRMITLSMNDKELRLNDDGTFDGEMTMED
ncbi:MAG TPA: hypothetical protein H9824_05610 [Candidatus Bacteroides pullicola]|uniref:Uncharacterized protein n=1 Tax=Candidatus Bacteroides pullicola TaxID=2838475 RepID=A0A9D2CKM9_9BACE|nr:hypothetical protein [Candidatus Bacteroides pullicola]